MRRLTTFALTAVLLAACAHRPVDPFFRLPVPAVEPGPAVTAPVGKRGGYLISFAVRRAEDASAVQLQEISVYPGQVAYLAVTNQTAYVRTFKAESVREACIADPVVDIVEDGVLVQTMATEGLRDGEVVLGFRAVFSDLERPLTLRNLHFLPDDQALTVQLPARAESETVGVQTLTLGRQTLLTHLPTPGREGHILLYATVHEVPLEAPADDEPGLVDSFPEERADPSFAELVARSRSLDDETASIRLALVEVEGAYPIGVPVVADHVLDAVAGATTPPFVVGVRTNLTDGVRLGTRMEHAFVARYDVEGTPRGFIWQPVIEGHLSGVEVFLQGNDDLRVAWTMRPVWTREHVETEVGRFEVDVPTSAEHEVHVRIADGDQLVPIVALADGRTDAVWVRIER